jgi:5-hydroxyisourate hydrolase-like protein (transthyretin family)
MSTTSHSRAVTATRSARTFLLAPLMAAATLLMAMSFAVAASREYRVERKFTSSARRRIAAICASIVGITGLTAIPASADASSITGTVVDAETGEPVPYASIYVYDADTYDFVGAAESDEDGRFSVDGLTEGSEYRAEVQAWPYIGQWLFGARWFDEADIITAPASVEVSLQPGVTVEGQLWGPSGEPAEGVHVNFFSLDSEWLASYGTDEEGRWWTLLPPGEFKVEFQSQYGSQWAIRRTSFDTATVFKAVAGEPLFIEDTLVDTIGTISGTVISASTNEPLADMCVHAVQPDDRWTSVGEACTGNDGTYALELSAGDYKIRFSDAAGNYARTYYGSDAFDAATVITVAAGEHVTGIDAALTSAAAIEGRIVDRTTRQPISDICVSAFEVAEPSLIDGQVEDCSDENGYWRIGGLPSGAVKLMTHGNDRYAAQWFDGANSHEDARIIKMRAGRMTKANFRLEEGATVTGTVTNEAGEPIEDACVQLSYVPISRVGGCDFGSQTDENGVYTIGNVPPGEQVFGAGKLWPHEYASIWNGGAGLRSAAEPITIKSGETTTLDFVLPPTATISGTVEIPEGYVTLNAYTVDGDMIGTGADVLNGEPAQPGPDGGFILAGLPTSTVLLEVTHMDPADWSSTTWWYETSESFATATPINVVSGQDTAITVTAAE